MVVDPRPMLAEASRGARTADRGSDQRQAARGIPPDGTSGPAGCAGGGTLDDLWECGFGVPAMRAGFHADEIRVRFRRSRAEVMFVGEAPAPTRTRRVFRRGASRPASHQDDRGDQAPTRRRVIANILKCRPPRERDPHPAEIEKCEPILLRQIEIIRPKIICALGRITGKTLLRTEASLAALRGKVHDYHGVTLVVTYHPAALLRNPNWKRPEWDDLKFLRREYDGMEIQ